MNNESKVIQVSGTTKTTMLAGAIAGTIRDGYEVFLRAIGANAVNQMVKAVIVATDYLIGDGVSCLAAVPTFTNVDIEGKERTAVVFSLMVFYSADEE